MNTLGHISKGTLVLCMLALSACGGGGGGGTPQPPPPPDDPPPTGGITRTGNTISVGAISGFGSVIVNGLHFDTTAATFKVDGDDNASQSDLSVGDVVLVKGTIDDDNTNAVAVSVEFDDNVEGPITVNSIVFDPLDPAAGGTFMVLGQTVHVSLTTSFDDSISPATIEGLSDGDIVEVSGLPHGDGSVDATRVEFKTLLPGELFEVTGIASGPFTGSSFMINQLVVDTATRSATFDNFPNGRDIAEGDPVEVKGEQTLGGASGQELIAVRVEYKGDRLAGDDGDHVEIEGFITRFVDATDFDVTDIPVTTDPVTTEFEGGDAGDLGMNLKVEVEGEYDNDILVATKVQIKQAKVVRMVALVDSVDPAPTDGSLPSLVMLDVTVEVDPDLTRFEDKISANREESLNIGHIGMSDYVEVRGQEIPPGSGILFAVILERDDPDTETIVRGFVESESPLTVLGVQINTTPSTQFRDALGNSIANLTDFLAAIDTNSVIKAKGTEDSGGNSITAEEIEIKNE